MSRAYKEDVATAGGVPEIPVPRRLLHGIYLSDFSFLQCRQCCKEIFLND